MKKNKTQAGVSLPSKLLMAICIASCAMPATVANASTGWLDNEIARMRAYPRLHRAHQAILKRDYAKAATALREYLALRPDDRDARRLYQHVLLNLEEKGLLSAPAASLVAKAEPAQALPAAATGAATVRPLKKHSTHQRARREGTAIVRSDSTQAPVMTTQDDRMSERSQDEGSVALNLAYASIHEGRPDEAVALFRRALQLDPQASTHIALARTHAMLREYDAAVEHYEQAAADDGLRATADHEHGNVLALQGQLGMAYVYWLQAERDNRSIDLQMKLAYAEAQTGEHERARQRLEAIDISAQPADVQTDIHYRLAELFDRTGDDAQAVRHLSAALPAMPSVAGYYRLALYALREQAWPQARIWLQQAVAVEPSNMMVQKQLGYVCKSLGDDDCAIQAFESALQAQPGQANLQGELGYAYARLGQNESARRWFRKAIDSYNAGSVPRSHLQTAEEPENLQNEATLSATDAYAIRRQVREMNRGVQFNAYQSYRPGSGAASTGTAPVFTTGGAIPSQGGIELLYQPADMGYRDGRTLRFFARTLWSNQPKSLAIDTDTLQGGVGIEYKPVKALNAYLSVERLLKIGDQSQDNTLLRVSWGYSDGYEMKAGVDEWNYTVAYADAGYLLEKDRTRSAYLELRQGRSFNWQDRWTLTPHLTVAGRAQAPDPQRASYAEIGAGVSWKILFNDSVYEAPRSSLELTLQYRKPLEHERSSGWVMIAALRY